MRHVHVLPMPEGWKVVWPDVDPYSPVQNIKFFSHEGEARNFARQLASMLGGDWDVFPLDTRDEK